MKNVMIGMSGGVDSSVAAWLLKEQGYNVIGATMRLWDADNAVNSVVEDARRVCDGIGIEFKELDLRDLFKEKVVDYFINEYTNGRTPNPCIMCNKHLKFGAMLDKALEMGIDYIATGHYARVEYDGEKYRLRISDAANKDQSYVLYNMTQDVLSHVLMPLGGYTKEQVKEIAKKLNLGLENKPESQEICFVEDDNYVRFILENSDHIPKTGDILDVNGNVIGEHKGIIHYTIGQRKGIGAYGRPMFVMKMDTEKNTITLGEKGMEFSPSLIARDVNFISGEFPQKPLFVQAKIRYQARPADAVITMLDSNRVNVEFSEPQRAVTPGQAVVFYDGNYVLGGGIVE